MVEAGGVEPPSEESSAEKPTCLAHSLLAFACGSQERARTDRRLASFPLRGSRPKFRSVGPRASPLIDASLRPAGLTKETAT